jgi:hypothetical protein
VIQAGVVDIITEIEQRTVGVSHELRKESADGKKELWNRT